MPVTKQMKCFWILMSSLCFCITARSQQKNPMFYSEIQLKHKPYTLQSITEEIQAQSGISFSYNADKISPNTRIKLSSNKLTVAAILAIIKKKTDIGYKIVSQTHIVYTQPSNQQKHTKATKPKRKIHTQNYVSKSSIATKQNFSLTTYNIAKTSIIVDSSNNANVVVIGDSGMVASYYSGGGYIGGGGSDDGDEIESDVDSQNDGSWKNDMPEGKIAHNNAFKKEDIINFFKNHALFSAGLSVDEKYYCNPNVRIGFSFLYGTVSYNVGSPSTFRYGLGTSAKINDNWRMHFNYSTGPSIGKIYIIQTFDTISPIDSFNNPTINETDKPLLVSSKLTRYSMGFNWNMGKGFSLEGDMVLNRLKTNYSSNSNPVNLSDFLPFGIDADSKYYAIKPPYTLGNSYSASNSSNIKTWIGFQFSLFYSLGFLER